MLLRPKNPKIAKTLLSIYALAVLFGVTTMGVAFMKASSKTSENNSRSFSEAEIPLTYGESPPTVPTGNQMDGVSLLFAGDMMLDRYVRASIQKNGIAPIFASLDPLLKSYDGVVSNLEGCFTDFSPHALDPNSLAFTFDPSLLPELVSRNFTIFSLANNHSLNFGATGLSQCKAYIEKAGVTYFGDPKNNASLSTVIEMKEHTFGFVGYNALERTTVADIQKEITTLKDKTDFIIVMPHWGNEYHESPSTHQTADAHALIDAGADLIIGAHPHVIQPIEKYKDKYIFYSLGNFIFDQTFSDETQTGLLVGAKFSDNGIQLDIFPMSNKKFQLTLLEGQTKKDLLQFLAEKSTIPEEEKEAIEIGVIKIEPVS